MTVQPKFIAVPLVLGVLAVAGASPAQAARPTPGVVSQAPLDAADFASMKEARVRVVRVLVRWAEIEPQRGTHEWGELDRVVGGASAHGIEVLPFVYGSPSWLAAPERQAPIRTVHERRRWSGFVKALVARYGPGGEFTREAGTAPIERWQIWNEPNFEFYWAGKPSPRGYVRLLEISARAIRSVDRRAKILLAGVAPIRSGMPWWDFLTQLYAIRGVRRNFDAVALHPYAETVADVGWQVERARAIMKRGGDRATPLALTEVGWSSGTERAPLVVGQRRQARNLTATFDLARRYRVSEVLWYAWRDALAVEPSCSFCAESGLLDFEGQPKRAWWAFRRVALQRN